MNDKEYVAIDKLQALIKGTTNLLLQYHNNKIISENTRTKRDQLNEYNPKIPKSPPKTENSTPSGKLNKS